MNITTYRTTREELSTFMLQHAAGEGWLYSKYDLDFYYNLKENQITTITVDDQAVGCVIYHENSGTINNMPVASGGLFFVSKQYRGQKIIGPKLLQDGFTTKLHENAFVCFHSVPRAVDFYERLGYQRTGLVNIAYMLPTSKMTLINTEAHLNCKILHDTEKSAVAKYNQSLFPSMRGAGLRQFIDVWLKRPDAIVVAAYEKDQIQGYGIATICKQTFVDGKEEIVHRIAPLYANSPTIAINILNKLLQTAEESNVTNVWLNSLATTDSYFGQSLSDIGFTELTRNYIVSNHVNMLDVNHSKLKQIFGSIPLEFPHEVASIC